ncbi:MAG TPA: heparinase II/III family protein, partial [Tepidisphaeraceae bacterium]|nr:heparinase II/III family protein [Tepidisphaeraceae bacterium]
MTSTSLGAILLLIVIATVASAAPTAEQQKLLDVKLTIQGRPEHPTVYMTRADIKLAQKNREQFSWAKKAADKIIHDADEWTNKDDHAIRKLLPPPGACFAYGFSGCPICNGKIGGWWGTSGCASFSDPGHVKCDKGHRLPDDDHPDTGNGWTDKSGKKYYFVGEYNAFVIDTLLGDALRPLCNAYALTGDMKYANKAAMLLDELARLYPTCDKGSWDYPSDPPSGRFNRPWYQVARTLISYTNFYDILMMGEALNSPSSVAGKTKRENIEQNMLLNGARYCYEQSIEHPSLTNGQADYIRGAMVVGVAMGIPEYINWTVDGPYSIRNMIENNIDRDGQYYETSAGYSHHSQYLYMDIAEILKRYSDGAHPDGIKLVENPKFRALFTLPSARLQVLGRLPTLGDDAPDLKTETMTTLVSDTDFTDLEHLRALSTDSQQKEQFGQLLSMSCGGNLEKRRGEIRDSDWLLFHADPVNPTQSTTTDDAEIVHPLTGVKLSESDLINQRGLAIVRRGTGRDARAFTLRAGPTLNHGHFDELNLNIYAGGHQLNYDLGYGLASTHTQVGWSHQTASHTTVLVNELSQL